MGRGCGGSGARRGCRAPRARPRLLGGGVPPRGEPYLVMEYVDGQPLDRYCDERRLDVPARLRLFAEVCDGVAFAHRNLVLHRDLKPSNIMLAPGGVVKILDFGIARFRPVGHETPAGKDGAGGLQRVRFTRFRASGGQNGRFGFMVCFYRWRRMARRRR